MLPVDVKETIPALVHKVATVSCTIEVGSACSSATSAWDGYWPRIRRLLPYGPALRSLFLICGNKPNIT